MRDYIKSVIDPNLTQNQNLNRIREYLQAYFLNIIYKNKFYQNLVFTGGTALRFIYRISRFLENDSELGLLESKTFINLLKK